MEKNKQFQKRIEDFTCQYCKAQVEGNGYTNHCPECLWSKHVDENPGDRSHRCEGMMEPTFAESTRKGYKIHHKCQECGIKRRVKSVPEDNFEVILALSSKPHREGREANPLSDSS